MRVPLSSERNAFWIAVSSAALIGGSVAIGVATVPLAGALLFAEGVVAAVVADVMVRDPDRSLTLREAAHAPHPHGPAPRRTSRPDRCNDNLA